MGHALRGVPVHEYEAPAGVVNQGGEWFYEEYAHGEGVSGLGLSDKPPSGAAPAASEEERSSILDMFRR
jgi:penicillin-binding protein 1A